jgi:hypothetical protein
MWAIKARMAQDLGAGFVVCPMDRTNCNRLILCALPNTLPFPLILSTGLRNFPRMDQS